MKSLSGELGLDAPFLVGGSNFLGCTADVGSVEADH